MRECILAEQTHAFVREQPWQVAVLPFGATEPHNLHMPYGTDTFQVEELGRRACARAYERRRRVILLPADPLRREHQPSEGPRRPGVQRDCRRRCWRSLTDLVDSLERQGV